VYQAIAIQDKGSVTYIKVHPIHARQELARDKNGRDHGQEIHDLQKEGVLG
jgi:hypothetical protein